MFFLFLKYEKCLEKKLIYISQFMVRSNTHIFKIKNIKTFISRISKI